jgi:hypothetical protein
MIEITTFRLAAGADDEAFRAADTRVQSDFAYRQDGLLRRTTARSAEGAWVVIDLWRSADAADAAAARRAGDPATEAFASFVDTATVETHRYDTLD